MLEKRKMKHELVLFLLIFAAIFIRYCYYGFHYYYQLDDYIIYHNFTAGPQSPMSVMMSLGLLGNRPLAWMADMFVWSHFYPVMLVGVAVISVLFAASACLFRWVFARHFGTSYLFCAVYTLLPLGFEGTYWMSAASRIVVGLFFTALALFEFERWCEGGKIRRLVLFIVFQLFSCCLYEQILIFSVTAVLLFSALNFKEHKRRSLWGLFALINAGVYFLIISYFSNGAVFSGRGTLLPPTTNYYWKTVFPGVVKQIKHAFLGGGFFTLFKGLKRGIGLLFSDFNFLYVLCLTILAISFFIFFKSSRNQVKKPVLGIISGILLAAAPLTIFFFVDNSWFSLRGTVTSFCGLALIADMLFALVFGKSGNFSRIIAVTGTLFIVLCCISSISELHDYKKTTEKDQQVARLLSEALKSDKLMRRDLRVGILNLDPTYLEDQNYNYHEHINGVTSDGWALQGALSSVSGYYVPDLAALPANPMYAPWNRTVNQLKNFNALYLYSGGKLIRVSADNLANGRYHIYTTDGTFVGSAREEDNYGYLQLAPGY